ncbi:unnamed protein product [Paramecium sonneborni]|uniref:Uncharacterized protein n=1 Tax=Paramecium sonneborni TaxID=65129 RepID=A0A8S1LLG1_9CILI|nr:unnamed protein product [Paramecium sonneborni]
MTGSNQKYNQILFNHLQKNMRIQQNIKTMNLMNLTLKYYNNNNNDIFSYQDIYKIPAYIRDPFIYNLNITYFQSL